jgi:hypothetical protein
MTKERGQLVGKGGLALQDRLKGPSGDGSHRRRDGLN